MDGKLRQFRDSLKRKTVKGIKSIVKLLLNTRARIIFQSLLFNLLGEWRIKPFASACIKGAVTFKGMDVQTIQAFITAAFHNLITYGALPYQDIKGKMCLEVGPGENLGLALCFLAAGAEKVVCIDKYLAGRDAGKERELYLALREGFSAEQRQNFDKAICLAGGKIVINRDKLLPLYGRGIDECRGLFRPCSFDIIYSNAVLEHIYRPERAFTLMDELLKHEGVMLHIVDFKDHGLFTTSGFHALEFLTIREPLYRWMTKHLAKPNRRHIDFYRTQLARFNYTARIYIQQLIGFENSSAPLVHEHLNLNLHSTAGKMVLNILKEKLEAHVDYNEQMLAYVRSIRPRLDCKFKSLSDEDLLIGSVIIAARKNPAVSSL